MSSRDGARVASIMLDCNDVDAMTMFWGAILNIDVTYRTTNYAWMEQVSHDGPMLAFQRVTEKKTSKNRLHLDLSTADPESLIARVEELGGERIEDYGDDEFQWTVCADPEGNEFCIAEPPASPVQ